MEVVGDFLEEFSSFWCHSSSLWCGSLDEFGLFELLEDFSDVASACFRGMVGFDCEAFSSTVVCSQVLNADGFVSVYFSEDACCAYVPPVWVLRLFFDVAACFGDLCPVWRVDLVGVFFEIFG